MSHPSYGKYTKEQIQKMIDAPYIWKPYSENPEESIKKRFSCRVSRDVTYIQGEGASIEIEAYNEDEAREILNDMDWDDFDWDEIGRGDQETDNYSVESIEELD